MSTLMVTPEDTFPGVLIALKGTPNSFLSSRLKSESLGQWPKAGGMLKHKVLIPAAII